MINSQKLNHDTPKLAENVFFFLSLLLCLQEVVYAQAPANDNCFSSFSFNLTNTITAFGDCSFSTDGSTINATDDGGPSGCDLTGTFLDVWYTFNSLNNTFMEMELQAPTLPSGQLLGFQILDNCGGTELDCSLFNLSGPYQFSVTPYTNYIFRIYSNTDYDTPVDFTMCLQGNNFVTWTGTVDTDWNNSANWANAAGPPTISQTAIIPAGASFYPTLNTTENCNGVYVRTGGSLTVATGASLNIDGLGTLEHAIENSGTITNNGTININNTSNDGFFNSNNGLMNNFGSLSITSVGDKSIVNNISSTFHNFSTGSIIATTAVNDGIFNSASSNMTNDGVLTLTNTCNTGEGTPEDAAIQSKGTFTNTGSILIDGSNKVGLSNNGDLSNDGLLEIGNTTNTGILNTGTSFTNESCDLIVLDGDILDNSNTFFNNGSIVINSGGNSDISTNNGIVQNLGSGTFTITTNNTILTDNAQAVYWTGCTSSDWLDNTNWHNSTVPDATSHVFIQSAINNAELSATGIIVELLRVNNGGELDILSGGELTVDGAANSLMEAKLRIFSGGTINVLSGANLAVQNANWDGMWVNGELNNSGTLTVENVSQFKGIDVGGSGSMVNNTDGGNIAVSNFTGSGFTISGGGVLNNDTGSSITLDRGSNTGNAGVYFFSDGTINNNGGSSFIVTGPTGGGAFVFGGMNNTITNASCSYLSLQGSVNLETNNTITNEGLLNFEGNSFNINAGTLDNSTGFLYDINNTLDCNMINGTCLVAPLSFADFQADPDNNSVSICQGDVDDIDLLICNGFVVTNANDSGPGSLRDVIACAPAGSTITIDPAVNYNVIYLTSGQLVIDKDLTIQGNDETLNFINGAYDDNSRLIFVQSGATLELRNFRLSAGGGDDYNDYGAAIYNAGNLTVVNCDFAYNRNSVGGAALDNSGGNMNVINCEFIQNRVTGGTTGAASIWHQGTNTNITQCLFYKNIVPAETWADMILFGDTQINNCTFIAHEDADYGMYVAGTAEIDFNNNIMTGYKQYPINAFGTVTGGHNLLNSFTNSNLVEGFDNNISGNPLFVDANPCFYCFFDNSPANDTGDDAWLVQDSFDIDNDGDIFENIDIDLSGNPRIQNGTVNIGAYENVEPFILRVEIGNLFLEGPYNLGSGYMDTELNWSELIPLEQPFNQAPWNYAGTESFVADGELPFGAVDWILIELLDPNNFNVLAQRAVALLDYGYVEDELGFNNVYFPGVAPGDYHITVRTRSHLAVVSSDPISLPRLEYEFEPRPVTIMGGASQLEFDADEDLYMLHAGDYDSDGIISVRDFNIFQETLNNGSTINVYEDADGNLDGNVTIFDFNLYKSNSSKIGAFPIRY